MNLTGKIINNRYKLNDLIAHGASSDLYRAMDTIEKKIVAVKIFRNEHTLNRTEKIVRFRAEVRDVAKLSHPNIIKLYDVGEFIGRHYLVAEFVEGETLSQLIDNHDFSLTRCIEIVIQISKALAFLHERNIIHREIKASNILISNKSDNIKIIDFGVANIKKIPENLTPEKISETFGCTSLEQSGVLNRVIDERSDIYSLGVLFYRLLTKKPPFIGNDLSSFIHNQIASRPPKCSSINKEVFATLDDIVFKLLEKEPEERYQSAQGLVADLESLLQGKIQFIPGLNDTSIRLSYRTKLVGREKEINRLKNQFDKASIGNGNVCLVRGDAGTGKTRLVEELKEYVVSQGGLFLGSKCYERESSEPFAPFKEIINKYVNSYDNYSEERKKAIRENLRKEFFILGRIITNLNSSIKKIIGDCPELPQLHSTRANERFYMTVGNFFSHISRHEKCLVLVVDDLHDADEATLILLEELAKNISYASILFVGISRQNELATKPVLKKFLLNLGEDDIPYEELELDSFNEKELNQFVAGLLFEEEGAVEELSQFIFSKSRGNPLFSSIILEQLIIEKILQYRNNHWSACFNALRKIEIPDSIVDAIIKKFHFLQDIDYQILSFAAVIGGDIDLDLLFQLCDLDTAVLVAIIDKAIALQILETAGRANDKVRFAHDRIREAFYEGIEQEEKKELHLKIAVTMEQMYNECIEEKVFCLARHFIEGGDDEKTAQYALPAAIQAKENYANDDAIRYFEKVLQVLAKEGKSDDSLQLLCKEQVGEVYLTVGEYDQAIIIFHQIIHLVKEDTRKVFIFMQLTNAHYRKSEWHNAEIFASKGLSLLKEKLPIKFHQVSIGIAQELFIHLFNRLFVWKKRSSKNPRYKRITSFYESLGMVYAVSDTLKLFRATLRELNLAYLYLGEKKEYATGLYGLGAICMYNGLFSLAHGYLSRSIEIHDSLGNVWGKARALEIMGYKYEFQGEFKKGKEYLEKAYDIFTSLGDLKEMGFALNGIEHYFYFTSNYNKAIDVNDQFYNLALKVKDYYFITAAHLYYAQIYREIGELDKSLSYGKRAYELSIEHDIWFNACTSSIELGCTSLALGDTTAAIEYLEKALALYEKNYFPKQYVICVYHNLAQAYVDDYLQKEHMLSLKECKAYRKKIRKTGALAAHKTRKWKTYYGSALRVLANCYAVTGKKRKAKEKFHQSLFLCEKNGRPFEHAKTLYDYGLFLVQWGKKIEGESSFESAYTIFCNIGSEFYRERLKHLLGIKTENKEQPFVKKLLFKERLNILSAFLDDLKRIDDENILLGKIIEQSLELASCRQGYLFIKNVEVGELELRSLKLTGKHEKKYSKEIVEKVAKTGKLIAINTTKYNAEEKKDNTIVCSNDISILCAPLLSQDKVIGVCYIDNPLAEGIFSDENIELLNSFFLSVSVEVERVMSYKYGEVKGDEVKRRRNITETIRAKIDKVIFYIQNNNNYLSDLSREGLASYVDINPDNLGKAFKLYTGMRISEYINNLRVKYAAERLVLSDDTILDIAYEAGFESISTFRRAFLKKMDVSPNKYRQKKGIV